MIHPDNVLFDDGAFVQVAGDEVGGPGIGHAYTIDTPINRVDVQLHAMTGLYSRGTGVDLGGPIEFRSGIEVAYHMENGMRLGLGWDHRSNLEIYARNPGVEMVHVRLSIPLE